MGVEATPIAKPTAQRAKPLLEAAVAYLRAHPEAQTASGRDLEATVALDGRSISYKSWNEAKKIVGNGN